MSTTASPSRASGRPGPVRLAVMALAASFAGAGQAPDPAIALHHVAVLSMESPDLLADQTVVVRGDTIESVEPAATATLPRDARVIDGRGRVLMPGLVDMHVHLRARSELLSYLRWGVTTVVHMGGTTGRIGDLVALREAIANGSTAGPRLLLAGSILDGPNPSFPNVSAVVTTAAEARDAVRDQFERGFDLIKVYNGVSPEALAGIAAESARVGMPFLGHVPREVGLERSLALGQALIAHSEEYFFTFFQAPRRTDIPLEEMRRYRPDYSKLEQAVRLTAAAGAAVTPNLSFIDATRRMLESRDEIFADPEFQFLDPQVQQTWKTGGPQTRRDLPQFQARERTRAEFARRLVAALSGHVPILTGTDSAAPGLFPGHALHVELALLVDAGLTPFDALAAATVAPGRFLHGRLRRAGRAGLVTPGYRADLLLIEGNPVTDVREVRSIVGVVAAGRYLTREALDAERRRALP